MTFSPWPFSRASALGAALFAAAVTVALLLCLPASSFAGENPRSATSRTGQGESSETALRSAGLLARGAGYDNQARSKAVRELQIRLRRRGHRPGPIDGMFGPLTEASVERFQRARGLKVDGVVGPRTRAQLLARRAGRPAAPHASATPKPGTPDRPAPDRAAPAPAPDRAAPANTVPPRDPAPEAGAVRPAAREPDSADGLEPWLAALLGALAMGVLLAGFSRLGRPRRGTTVAERRGPAPLSTRSRLNLGMAWAVLLAVFALGAASGALFATHAAPDERDRAEVASGAVLPPSGASPIRHAKPADPLRKSGPELEARRRTAPAPNPRPDTAKLPESGGVFRLDPGGAGFTAPATAPARPVAPVQEAGGTYAARPGDSPRPSATGQPVADGARTAVGRRVRRLLDVNLEESITSGDPDLLAAEAQPRGP
jgi:peptidoglycan hydrolase-like protein with peptidoglycan-binding domain